MSENHLLKPLDIPVALCMAIFANSAFSDVAYHLDISPSTAFRSAGRLTYAGLARTVNSQRRINTEALLEFLAHGVRYAFPARKGTAKRGVATAYAAPILRDFLDSDAEPV